LNKNFIHNVKRTNFPSTIHTLFTMNRSYQEVKSYNNVNDYFKKHFKEADICLLSSHLEIEDIEEMIYNLHKRYYNVAGVFWRNKVNRYAADIAAKLNWN